MFKKGYNFKKLLNNFYTSILSIVIITMLCSCTTNFNLTKSNDVKTNDSTSLKKDTIKWLMPVPEQLQDTNLVLSEFNTLIQKTLPNVNIDFILLNKYEYYENLNLYLAANQQLDIVWCNDSVLPFLFEVNKNSFKSLKYLIDQYAPNIKSNLTPNIISDVQMSDNIYYIPNLTKANGLIPFLKIPKHLSSYFDIDKLISEVTGNDTINSQCFSIIEDYLKKLKANNILLNGVDVYSLNQVLPYKGYETLLSTANILGYKKSDPQFNIVNIQTSDEVILTTNSFKDWYSNGYIRDDIDLVNKQHNTSNNNYILGAAWGFFIGNTVNTVIDENASEDWFYIPLDNRYYTSRLTSSSVNFIPRTSKEPETAIKILDMLYDKKNNTAYKLLSYGVKDKHYSVTDNYITKPNIKNTSYSMYPSVISNPINGYLQSNNNSVASVSFTTVQDPLRNFKLNVYKIQKDLLNILLKYDSNKSYFSKIITTQNLFRDNAIYMDKIIKETQLQVNDYISK